MAPELIGKTFSHYQIIDRIDESAYGYLFTGVDLKSHKPVTIRVLPEGLAQQPKFTEKFLVAARAASRLDNPGLIDVLDYGSSDGYLYLVMEDFAVETLAQKLAVGRERRELLPLLEIVQISRQLALACDYASQKGVNHIDLHPSNILVRPGRPACEPVQPVLIDTGFSWLVSSQMSTAGHILARFPGYSSPEQLNGSIGDVRSDIFSFGVLLYELATYKLPFTVDTVEEALEFHRNKPLRPPSARRPAVPENLESIILKALDKDPAQRFADFTSVADALLKVDAWLVRHPPSKPITPEPPRKTGPLPPKREARPPDMDYLLVETPGKPAITIPIAKAEMSIGRGKSADIPLNSLGVSRSHATLLLDGREYYLIDHSTNGTFLDDGRLLPGVRDLWSTNKVARIGPFTIHLVRAGKTAPITADDRPITQIYKRDGSLAEQKHIHVSSGEGRIGVFLEEDEVEVSPGECIGMTVILRNQGETVDHFKVSIEGVPVSWINIQPQAVFLMPQNQDMVQVTYKPPRLFTSKAGIYDLTIRVSSVEAPDQWVDVIATLTVMPFVEYSCELHPQKIDTNQRARVTINNKGNNTETFLLTLKDRGDELKFSPPQAQVQVPEGRPAAIEFSAKTRRMHIMRKPVSHPYSADLSVASGGEKRTFNGEIVSNGFIPLWLPPLLLVACLALAAAIPLGYKLLTQATPTPTVIAVAATATIPFQISMESTATLPGGAAITPTQAVTPTPTPFCGGAPSKEFKKGDTGRVTSGIKPFLNLNVHQNPEPIQGNIIYEIPIGTQFQIINGPECIEVEETGQFVIMWQIKVDSKQMKFRDGSSKGWVVAGESLNYYIEPVK